MTPTNQEIAQKLREHASELARNGDNLYRVRAFRQAAMAVRAAARGRGNRRDRRPKGLERLPASERVWRQPSRAISMQALSRCEGGNLLSGAASARRCLQRPAG